MKKPIGAALHGILDYGFVAIQFAAPSVLKFGDAAKAVSYSFGATTAILTGLTDQPYGLRKVIPLRLHGEFDTLFLPMLLAIPWLSGAFKEKTARLFFGTFFALALTNYLLTNYNDGQPAALTEGQS